MPAPFLLRETVACTMPEFIESVCRRRRRPAAAQNECVRAFSACQCHERFGEPYPVHIVSLPCVALPDGAVHGAYPFGCRVNLVEVVHDGPFVGSGDVEAQQRVFRQQGRQLFYRTERVVGINCIADTFPAEHLCEPFRRERVGEGITDESERTHGKGVRKRI